MVKYVISISLILLMIACSSVKKQPVDYVDPFIGTGFHGHTYPGATVPFGAVQLSPDTRRGNWDACSGYHYSDTTILGFSHTHLSGTGCIDLGDILFHPTTKEVKAVKDGYTCCIHTTCRPLTPGCWAEILLRVLQSSDHALLVFKLPCPLKGNEGLAGAQCHQLWKLSINII